MPNPWTVLDFPFSLFSSSLYLSSVSTERDFLCRREAGEGEKKSARGTMLARAYIFLLFYFLLEYPTGAPVEYGEPVRFH